MTNVRHTLIRSIVAAAAAGLLIYPAVALHADEHKAKRQAETRVEPKKEFSIPLLKARVLQQEEQKEDETNQTAAPDTRSHEATSSAGSSDADQSEAPKDAPKPLPETTPAKNDVSAASSSASTSASLPSDENSTDIGSGEGFSLAAALLGLQSSSGQSSPYDYARLSPKLTLLLLSGATALSLFGLLLLLAPGGGGAFGYAGGRRVSLS
jgi:hypothetical protein